MKYLVIFLFLFTSCRTITKSMTLGGSVGALAGAGIGGAMHYEDRKKGAFALGVAGAAIGAGISYYLYKDNEKNAFQKINSFRTKDKKAFETKLSKALSKCLNDDLKPELVPQFVPSQVKGGKFIGSRVDWNIQNKSLTLSPERQKLLEEKKGGDNE